MNCLRASSSATVVSTPLPAANVRNSPPAPDQWTLVREYNIEKRDDFTVSNITDNLTLSISHQFSRVGLATTPDSTPATDAWATCEA